MKRRDVKACGAWRAGGWARVFRAHCLSLSLSLTLRWSAAGPPPATRARCAAISSYQPRPPQRKGGRPGARRADGSRGRGAGALPALFARRAARVGQDGFPGGGPQGGPSPGGGFVEGAVGGRGGGGGRVQAGDFGHGAQFFGSEGETAGRSLLPLSALLSSFGACVPARLLSHASGRVPLSSSGSLQDASLRELSAWAPRPPCAQPPPQGAGGQASVAAAPIARRSPS